MSRWREETDAEKVWTSLLYQTQRTGSCTITTELGKIIWGERVSHLNQVDWLQKRIADQDREIRDLQFQLQELKDDQL